MESKQTEGLRDHDDMAAVGNALMDAIEKNYAGHPFMKQWHPCDCPSEIVGDLLNALDEGRAEIRALYRAYVQLLDSGRQRILALGGDCDSVERMEEGDPALIRARNFLPNAESGQ